MEGTFNAGHIIPDGGHGHDMSHHTPFGAHGESVDPLHDLLERMRTGNLDHHDGHLEASHYDHTDPLHHGRVSPAHYDHAESAEQPGRLDKKLGGAEPTAQNLQSTARKIPGINKPIDHSNDVIGKPAEATAPAAAKAGKAAEAAEAEMGFVRRALKTTSGKVGAGILATSLVLGGVMTYRHFKNRGDTPDGREASR